MAKHKKKPVASKQKKKVVEWEVCKVIVGTRAERQRALAERRANQPEPIDNASLYAGSSMYFECKSCGHGAAVLPESFACKVPQLCPECAALKELGWLK